MRRQSDKLGSSPANRNETMDNSDYSKTSFIGDARRSKKIEQLVTTAEIIRKRPRGRQRRKITDQIKDWTMTSCNYDVFKRAKEESHGCRRIWTCQLDE